MIGEGLTSGTHINPKNEGAEAADLVLPLLQSLLA